MAAKRKKKRLSPRCIVCCANPRDAGHSKLCDDCDMDYAVALDNRVGTIEWAAKRARAMMKR